MFLGAHNALLLAAVLLTSPIATPAITATQNSYKIVANNRISGEGLLTGVSSLLHCLANCRKSPLCIGANYNSKENQCEVLKSPCDDNTPGDSLGWMSVAVRLTHGPSTTVPSCPSDFEPIGFGCYHISTASEYLRYADADDECLSQRLHNAELVSFETHAEYRAIRDHMVALYPSVQAHTFRWLIGARYDLAEGEFVWATRESLNQSAIDWGDNQPDGGENCLAMKPPDFRVNDVPCGSNRQQFICEYV